MTEVTNKPTVWGKAIPRWKNFGSLANVIHFFPPQIHYLSFPDPASQFPMSDTPEYKIPLFFFLSSLCLHCDTGYSGQVYLFCLRNLGTSAGSALSLMNPVVACQYQSCILWMNGDFSAKEKSWFWVIVNQTGFSWHSLQSKLLCRAFWLSYYYPQKYSLRKYSASTWFWLHWKLDDIYHFPSLPWAAHCHQHPAPQHPHLGTSPSFCEALTSSGRSMGN